MALLAAAGCSPRAASSEPGSTPTTSPPSLSYEALGQTTTTLPPVTGPIASPVATTSPPTDPAATTNASTADGTVSVAGVEAATTATTVQMSVITPPPTTAPPPPPLTVQPPRPDGTVPVVIAPTVTRFSVRSRDNGGDPYYQVRTTTDVPFLFDVELYTKSGAGWTGQLGTFATDCELNGICVYLRMPPGSKSHAPPPAAMVAEPLGQVTIGRLVGGVQLHLQQLRFRALGSQQIYLIEDVVLDPVPPS